LIAELEADEVASKDNRFLLAKLQSLDNGDSKEPKSKKSSSSSDESSSTKIDPEKVQKQIELADKIVATIDLNAIVNGLSAAKLDSKKLLFSSAQIKRHVLLIHSARLNLLISSLEKDKSLLVDSLVIKGVALCSLLEAQKSAGNADESASGDLQSKIREVYLKLYTLNKELEKDTKVGKFLEKHAWALEHYGRYVKLLQKSSNQTAAAGEEAAGGGNGDSTLLTQETDAKVRKALEKLQWNHLVKHLERSVHVKYPKAYRLF